MNKVVITLLGIITAVVLLVGGFYLGQRLSSQPAPQETAAPTQTPSETVTPTEETGAIEGSLSFPSEGIPEDMFVCAETLQGQQVVCTSEHVQDSKYQYGEGYILEINPGTYYVYAQLPDDDYKAYYTEHVTCGLTVECKSHEKIEVAVEAGETVSSIDPIDWYNISPGE